MWWNVHEWYFVRHTLPHFEPQCDGCTYPSIHLLTTLKLSQNHGRLSIVRISKDSPFSWRRHSQDHGRLPDKHISKHAHKKMQTCWILWSTRAVGTFIRADACARAGVQLNLHYAFLQLFPPRWYRLQRRRMVRRGASVTNSNHSMRKGNACISGLWQSSTTQRMIGLERATSCLASAVSSPNLGDMQAAKRVGRNLVKAVVAWQGFPFHDPRSGELLCYTDVDWASDKTSRRSTSGGVVTLGGGVLNCWAKKQKSVALSSWESELFAAITSGTRSLGSRTSWWILGTAAVSLSRQKVRASLITRSGVALRQSTLVLGDSGCMKL